MKKTLVAIAAIAAATGAMAQSTVTLSGSVSYGQTTSTANAVSYGGWKGDRNVLNIGVNEDLGEGRTAAVLLQTRFNTSYGGVNTGYVSSATGLNAGNTFEQTKVTLADKSLGEVSVGRFTNAMGVAPLHPFEDSAQSTAPHQAVNGRLSGQTQYTSPSFMGLQAFALNAQASANKFMGSGSGGGYDSTLNLATTGNEKNFGAYGFNYANGPIYAQALSYNDLMGVRATKIGASYDLGANLYGVKLFANQFNQKNDMIFAASTTISTTTGATTASTAYTSMQAHKATELAATMPYGNFTFMAGRMTTDRSVSGANPNADKVTKTAWGTTYALSKRTSLQYYASSTTNAGYSAATNSSGLAQGRSQWAGVQHSF
jgi:Gram-negative porin